jgi:hypothetical protein
MTGFEEINLAMELVEALWSIQATAIFFDLMFEEYD